MSIFKEKELSKKWKKDEGKEKSQKCTPIDKSKLTRVGAGPSEIAPITTLESALTDHSPLESLNSAPRGKKDERKNLYACVTKMDRLTNTKNQTTSPFKTVTPTKRGAPVNQPAMADHVVVAGTKAPITAPPGTSTKDAKAKRDEENVEADVCDVFECPNGKKPRKEKLCRTDDCPAVIRKKIVKETKKAEKRFGGRKNPLVFLGEVVMHAFAQDKEVCRLSKEEKKLWKRMKSNEEDAEEQFRVLDVTRFKSWKKSREVQCGMEDPEASDETFPTVCVNKEHPKPDKATSCVLPDCPVILKKQTIKDYVDKAQNYEENNVKAVVDHRTETESSCPKTSCRLKEKHEEYFRKRIAIATKEKHPRAELTCIEASHEGEKLVRDEGGGPKGGAAKRTTKNSIPSPTKGADETRDGGEVETQTDSKIISKMEKNGGKNLKGTMKQEDKLMRMKIRGESKKSDNDLDEEMGRSGRIEDSNLRNNSNSTKTAEMKRNTGNHKKEGTASRQSTRKANKLNKSNTKDDINDKQVFSISLSSSRANPFKTRNANEGFLSTDDGLSDRNCRKGEETFNYECGRTNAGGSPTGVPTLTSRNQFTPAAMENISTGKGNIFPADVETNRSIADTAGTGVTNIRGNNAAHCRASIGKRDADEDSKNGRDKFGGNLSWNWRNSEFRTSSFIRLDKNEKIGRDAEWSNSRRISSKNKSPVKSMSTRLVETSNSDCARQSPSMIPRPANGVVGKVHSKRSFDSSSKVFPAKVFATKGTSWRSDAARSPGALNSTNLYAETSIQTIASSALSPRDLSDVGVGINFTDNAASPLYQNLKKVAIVRPSRRSKEKFLESDA